jgi:hypothetical protein
MNLFLAEKMNNHNTVYVIKGDKMKTILSEGFALCNTVHYNKDLDLNSSYRFQRRRGKNQIHFRVYNFDDWGREEYSKYNEKDFHKFFEIIEYTKVYEMVK